MDAPPVATESLLNRESKHVEGAVREYVALHAEGSVADRQQQYGTLINHYYDLATDFYEFGWGRSFHFAQRKPQETFGASLARHERFLAAKLGLAPGMRVIDAGCGVGGPMQEICRASGAEVIGLNINAYQVKRGRRHLERAGLTDKCRFLECDFMNIPIEDETIDAAYGIEATCHAPDRTALFREICRVLKPGAEFAGYEWCMTDRYDASSAEHRQIKKDIEVGDGLPDLCHTSHIDESLVAAGFELIEACDLAENVDPGTTPWHVALSGTDGSLRSLPRTPLGRRVTGVMTRVLERVRIAPKGTAEVSDFLNAAADALVAGGEKGLFTPMYYFRARKS